MMGLKDRALAFQTLKHLGVAYLPYMAWNALREQDAPKVEQDVGTRSAMQVIISAILINILIRNRYWLEPPVLWGSPAAIRISSAASEQRAAWSTGRLHDVDIQIGDGWRKGYPEASIGILAMDGVENPPEHAALTEHVRQVEDDLRGRWAGATRADLNRLPEFEAYRRHYRRFDKTYHVQLQFESVVLNGKLDS
jgi:LysE type translocator